MFTLVNMSLFSSVEVVEEQGYIAYTLINTKAKIVIGSNDEMYDFYLEAIKKNRDNLLKTGSKPDQPIETGEVKND